ncbi:MAG: hypothetical protein OXF98_11620 [Rhodospirillaceae bacterium]|nr:hypothetical protein [Rhodospirillaceae bacterium]
MDEPLETVALSAKESLVQIMALEAIVVAILAHVRNTDRLGLIAILDAVDGSISVMPALEDEARARGIEIDIEAARMIQVAADRILDQFRRAVDGKAAFRLSNISDQEPPLSGIGVEYDHPGRILQLFVIADDGRTARLGLTVNDALAFVRKVLEMMGIRPDLIEFDPPESPAH